MDQANATLQMRAIDWLQAELAANRALIPAVLALAEHQLKHPDEARTALDEASQVIQHQLAIDRNYDDLLIAEILFREAEALINGK